MLKNAVIYRLEIGWRSVQTAFPLTCLLVHPAVTARNPAMSLAHDNRQFCHLSVGQSCSIDIWSGPVGEVTFCGLVDCILYSESIIYFYS